MYSNSNEELDRRLQVLIAQAQRHPPQSTQRQLALTKLFKEVKKSQKLFSPGRSGNTWKFQREVYEDAIQELWLYVCNNVDKYDSSRASVIGWLNMLLNTRFLRDEMETYGDTKYIRIQGEKQVFVHKNLSDLDNQDRLEYEASQASSQSPPDTLPENVRQCIEADARGMFKTAHVQNCPEANWQAIALKRIARESWEDISRSFGGISVATLSSFYQRNLKKFVGYLREQCQD